MLKQFIERLKNDKREMNRFFVLAMGCLFVLNYLMFCFHTGKNVFDIFPSIPVLDEKQKITVYLPAFDGQTILSENRDVPRFRSRDRYVKYLFDLVAKGSVRENTSQAVPVPLFVKMVWIDKDNGCILDIDAEPLRGNAGFKKGSEELFKQALRKTLSENIPGLGGVQFLVDGVPGRRLWEI